MPGDSAVSGWTGCAGPARPARRPARRRRRGCSGSRTSGCAWVASRRPPGARLPWGRRPGGSGGSGPGAEGVRPGGGGHRRRGAAGGLLRAVQHAGADHADDRRRGGHPGQPERHRAERPATGERDHGRPGEARGPVGLLGSEAGADPLDEVGRHRLGLGQGREQRTHSGRVVLGGLPRGVARRDHGRFTFFAASRRLGRWHGEPTRV